jgi:hypothetical protein
VEDVLKSKEEKYMALSLSFHRHMSGQPDVRPSMPMPMVYENVPITPTHWEYRVLASDTREEGLPDAALLNELGGEGWLLVGVLEQKAADGRRTTVNYYFVRQKTE